LGGIINGKWGGRRKTEEEEGGGDEGKRGRDRSMRFNFEGVEKRNT
jgi:hypothetical protein